ncbi:MAG: acyltransferase [Candidatus Paceibacterota bacterium]|jgi:galactoside O-acetyltransferase
MSYNFGSIGTNVFISPKSSIYGAEHIFIGNNVRIDDFVIISAKEPVIIGNYVHIAPYCGLYGACGIEMKDFSGMSSRVAIYSISDDYSGESLTNPTVPDEYKHLVKGKVTIGRHVDIGCGSLILPGVEIGDGSSVMAMSLLNKSFECGFIIGGNPARKIKERSQKIFELEKEFLGKL